MDFITITFLWFDCFPPLPGSMTKPSSVPGIGRAIYYEWSSVCNGKFYQFIEQFNERHNVHAVWKPNEMAFTVTARESQFLLFDLLYA